MQSFEEQFLKSHGQPIKYKGQIIQMIDRLTVTDGQKIIVFFESVNSDWRQGVHLSTDGVFEVEGQAVKNVVVLWHDTAPRRVPLIIRTVKSECMVKNVWDVGDGVMHSWHNGAAMIAENVESGRRYKCNDGRADDNFNDLVFRLELSD